MKNQDKISFAINQIPINNCDGSVNEKAIKAVRYLQEVHEALSQVADNFTGYFDNANKPIFVGDKLKSEWNYEVIVVKDEDGNYSGKLVCDDTHSCKNIPYALNKGKGYSKIICT